MKTYNTGNEMTRKEKINLIKSLRNRTADISQLIDNSGAGEELVECLPKDLMRRLIDAWGQADDGSYPIELMYNPRPVPNSLKKEIYDYINQDTVTTKSKNYWLKAFAYEEL